MQTCWAKQSSTQGVISLYCANVHCIVKEWMEIMVVHIRKSPMDNYLCCERREMDHNVIKKEIR